MPAGRSRVRAEHTATRSPGHGSRGRTGRRGRGNHLVRIPARFGTPVVRTVASMAGEGGKPTESAGTPAYVDREHPVQEVRFSLLRPGEITGRVVDDDDNPVTGLAIAVQHRATCVVFGPDPRAVTDSCRCRRHTVRFCYARKVGQAFLPAAGFLAGVVYPTTAVRRGTCASRRDCFPDRCTRTSRRWRSMESPNRPTT